MRMLQGVERACWLVFAVCAGICLHAFVQARAASQAAHSALAAPSASSDGVAGQGPVAPGAILGRLEIDRLNLSVPVLEDDQSKSLLRGLGHIRGTAMLGGLGTVALAGHRDTFLRPIRNIENGMEMRAVSSSGTYHYLVDSTEIVPPERVHVLDIQDRPELVLITCYPFNYIGAAPRRFIVHAHLVSVMADSPKPNPRE